MRNRDPHSDTELSPEEKRGLLAELLAQRTRSRGQGRLSPAQERLWFLESLSPGTSVYTIPIAVRIEGPVDRGALDHSVREIVARHPMLRAVFSSSDGVAVVRYLDADNFRLVTEELDTMDAARAAARRFVQVPFDLEKGPLFRARLFAVPAENRSLLACPVHHIVSDGWSVGILLRDLQRFYGAGLHGKEEKARVQPAGDYSSYVAWQRERLAGPILQEQASYWRRQLAPPLGVLDLPSDRPRPAVQSHRGDCVYFDISPEETEQIRAFSREAGVTPYATLLAAFAVLLHRLSGQHDVLVGTPVAGRLREEDEETVGLFVNTVVVRCDLSDDPAFRDLAGRVGRTAVDAMAHQDLPFERLVDELKVGRDLSRPAVFQVMFSMMAAPFAGKVVGGAEWTLEDVVTGTSKFDLTLDVIDHREFLRARLEYSTDLFTAETAERVSHRFRHLLAGVLDSPTARVSHVSFLPAEERRTVLEEWNRTARPYPRGGTLHGLFEEQVRRTPDAVAVLSEGKQLTYANLNRRANRLAHRLRDAGVGPEVLVGICMDRRPEMIVAMLGVLKAGGAYVPLDPAYPAERLAFTMEDSRAQVLITQERLKPRFAGTTAEVLCFDGALAGNGGPDHNPDPLAKETSLAYVIYTSGSTGRPKGVAIEHRSAATLVYWAKETYTDEETRGTLASTSICFDLSVFEIFTTLARGSTVVLVDNALSLSGLSDRGAVTLLNTVPSAAQELARAGLIPPSVVTINLAGEPLSAELVDTLYSYPHVRRVFDLYGPSEDTTYSTFALREPGGRATIGRPLPNTRLYILGGSLEPVPIGVPGEIHLAGAGLARGYLHREDLTRERFVPDPFSDVPDGRMYRTGDLGRFLPDGNVEFLGRIDHQVKVRGFRIELGEVESVMRSYPGVTDAAVVAREDEAGAKQLVAYVAMGKSTPPGVHELRAHLAGKLPEYMLPARFVFLEALPMTPNGKVDRKALPDPSWERAPSADGPVSPRDILEQQLVHIWEKLFQRTSIGIRDNFFDLGGNSLMAVRLFAQVEKLTGKTLPLVTLFQAPTIEQVASLLKDEGWAPHWSSLVPIKVSGSRPTFYGVHGVGGNILEFSDLVKYAHPDQPIYGLQAQGLDGKRPLHTTVEEMAEHYVNEIREFQPQGPYYIGGSSFGGVIAYEMALRLTAMGESVALLAMFDSMAPGFPIFLPNAKRWMRALNKMRYRVELHAGNLKVTDWPGRVEYIRVKAVRFLREVRNQYKKRRRRIKRRIEAWFYPKGIKGVPKGGEAARAVYKPGRYNGAITLFRATEEPYDIVPDPTNGWSNYAGGSIEIIDIPGHHGSIMREPRIQYLANRLMLRLEQAQSESGAPDRTGERPSAGPTFTTNV